ncbi:MAG: fimbria/pilus outer membrane usher protein [Gammaproteobacteria bacterium]
MSPATLFLELTINGRQSRNAVPVRQAGEEFEVRREDLLDAGVRREAIRCDEQSDWVALKRCPEIRKAYDSHALRLDLSVPPSWLGEQRLSGRSPHDADPALGNRGALLNYDAYFNRTSNRFSVTSLWSEQRVFASQGAFTNTGVARWISGNSASVAGLPEQQRYARYDTRWTTSDESRLMSWTVGDLVTGSQTWSSSARLGGIQLGRDFRLRPDLVTYPLPQFSGEAAIPTTLDLLVNGYRAGSQRVQPGPFTITDIPAMSGAGEATIVATDALGRRVATTLPFYVSSDLLQRGLADYSASVGALRRDYGLQNFSYGRPAASGSARYGVTDSFTIEGQLDAAGAGATGPFVLAGAGGVLKARMAGVLNGSISRSDSRANGGLQYTFGYRYTLRGFSVGYQGTRASEQFRNLGSYDRSDGLRPSRSSDVITASLSTNMMGTVSAGYFDLLAADSTRLRMLNLSYTRPLRGGISFSVSANRDIERGQNTAQIQVIAALGRSGNITLGNQQSTNAGQYVNYTRSTPTEGGLGWNAGYLQQEGESQEDLALAWSNPYNRMEAGIYGTSDERTRWGSARGSLIVMDNELFVARQVSDAFVVITTDGVADVPVRYENQLVGRTDNDGYLLVPWVTSRYSAKYEIDPLDLPPQFRVQEVEQRITVMRGGGAVLRFEVKPITAAMITLVNSDGTPVPVGSDAVETETDQRATVGFDGLVYFEDLQTLGALAVTRADGSRCAARFQLPDRLSQVAHIGPLVCE